MSHVRNSDVLIYVYTLLPLSVTDRFRTLLGITLSIEMADVAKAKVQTGEYATEREVARYGPCAPSWRATGAKLAAPLDRAGIRCIKSQSGPSLHR